MNTTTIYKCLQTALQIEELGNKFYSDYATKVTFRPDLKALFEQLSRDERGHKLQIQKLIDQLSTIDVEISDEEETLLDILDPSRFLQALSNKPEPTISDVLECAFRFEKESIHYYQNLQDIFGRSPELSAMISMEKGHLHLLFKVLATEGKFYSLSDTWP